MSEVLEKTEVGKRAPAASALPSPELRPGVNVVIYDGDCKFCSKQVRTLARLDWFKTLAFVSLHDEFVARKYPGLTYDQLMEQIYVVTPQGVVYGGASAVRFLSRQMPGLWILMPLLHIPGSLPLWQSIYGWIARRRYKISQRYEGACENDACSVHFGGEENSKE
jgi:predicted DCC family thiol-disulfide oxidoreductase YuxK